LPLLLETIKIEGGQACHLAYHQKRFDLSRKNLFGKTDSIDLSTRLTPPSKALYRCRIIYDTEIHSLEYLPYREKEIRHLKIVASEIDYRYKYAQRETFDTLLKAHPDADDILIEKEGYITDTTVANIAFYDGTTWFTPESPLLYGTTRARLIDEGLLKTRAIKSTELHTYTHVALMNAMIGFKLIDPISIK